MKNWKSYRITEHEQQPSWQHFIVFKINVFYVRLVSKHKPKKVTVIACMRNLLLITHAIHKNKTVYVLG
ncbi:hypothetical protein ES705_18147 [subsurface metagenome]